MSTTRSDGPMPDTHARHHAHHAHHTALHRIVTAMDEKDAADRYREAAADHTPGATVRLPTSTDASTDARTDTVVVAWTVDDPQNPYNWSRARKAYVLVATMLAVINSTMGSSLPSNAMPYIAAEWSITSSLQRVLPVSLYLVGYILGPLAFAPLSEQYGRARLLLGAFCIFLVWTMACALAPSWTAFLVFRLLTGVFASAPLAIVTGIMADIFASPVSRGRAMAVFMVMTLLGPLFSPIVSGYCATTIGWRWTFWVALAYAAASLVPLVFLPETFGPVLLQRRAERLRRADPDVHVVAPHELVQADGRALLTLLTVVLTRPLRMMASEMIVASVCSYLALVYAIFYMTFQAYPLIFQGLYNFSPGREGLLFLTIGAGSVIALPVFYAYDAYLQRAVRRHEPWTRKEEYRRLPLACLGGPIFVASLFWLGWSARADVAFVVPMLAGIPFGLGFILIFMALLNYLTDAYEIFAASANAAASCCRSLLATVLPLAAGPMFRRLGIAGACSLLGGLSLLMCAIPFVFLWKGDQIRARSSFCVALKERRLEMESRERQHELGRVVRSGTSPPKETARFGQS